MVKLCRIGVICRSLYIIFLLPCLLCSSCKFAMHCAHGIPCVHLQSRLPSLLRGLGLGLWLLLGLRLVVPAIELLRALHGIRGHCARRHGVCLGLRLHDVLLLARAGLRTIWQGCGVVGELRRLAAGVAVARDVNAEDGEGDEVEDADDGISICGWHMEVGVRTIGGRRGRWWRRRCPG